MRPSFQVWLDTLDPDGKRSATAPSGWLSLAVIVAVGLWIAGVMPGAREFFQLDYVSAGLCFLPALALGLVGGTLQQRGRLSLREHGSLLLIGSFLFQSFMWSLVSFSALPGASAMAAFPVLQAAYQGHLTHVTLKHPFGLFSATAALIVGYLLDAHPDHFAIYVLVGPMALAANVLVGTFSMSDHRSRVERAALRAAVDAQLLKENAQETRHLSQIISGLRGRHHDAGNALSGALVNLNLLAMKLNGPPLDANSSSAITEIARDCFESLERLRSLLEEARAESSNAGAEVQTFDLIACVDGAIRDTGQRFPQVSFDKEIRSERGGYSTKNFMLVGGELTFTRMLTNLLLNACQGDGVRGAKRVDTVITVAASGDNWELRVNDDGPGFSSAQIEGPITGFQTTKATGTGLGLFIVERLAAANGGTVRRGNQDAGGAWVALSFARELGA